MFIKSVYYKDIEIKFNVVVSESHFLLILRVLTDRVILTDLVILLVFSKHIVFKIIIS